MTTKPGIHALEAARPKLFERLDRFEPRFFKHMAEAQKRVRQRGSR